MSKYVVKSGDTLSGIAARYGTTWQEIYNANKSVIGSDPGLIRVGQTLSLGGGSSSSGSSGPGLSAAAKGYQQVTNELKQYEQKTQKGLAQYKSDREAIYAEQRAEGEAAIDKGIQQQIDSYEHEQAKMDKDMEKQSRAQYVQYEQQMNPYGMQEEAIQEMGLARSGFAETTRARAFNAYQVAVSNMWEKTQEIAADFEIKMNEARAQGDIQRAQLLIQENERRLADIEYENRMQQQISEIRLQIAESERNFRYQVEYDEKMYQLELDRQKRERERLAWEKEMAALDRQIRQAELAYQKQQSAAAQSSWTDMLRDKEPEKKTSSTPTSTRTVTTLPGYSQIGRVEDSSGYMPVVEPQKKSWWQKLLGR